MHSKQHRDRATPCSSRPSQRAPYQIRRRRSQESCKSPYMQGYYRAGHISKVTQNHVWRKSAKAYREGTHLMPMHCLGPLENETFHRSSSLPFSPSQRSGLKDPGSGNRSALSWIMRVLIETTVCICKNRQIAPTPNQRVLVKNMLRCTYSAGNKLISH